MATLIPDYLSLDFDTIMTRLKSQLQNSETFVDYNYEGANITLLMELLSYVGELNTFLLNKIAQNIHIETADIYEAVNRNARMMGYEPKGPRSSRGTVTVTVCGATPLQEYKLFDFTQMTSTETFDGANINFANTTTYSQTPTASTFAFDVDVRQGIVSDLTGYTGTDLVDNELLLPTNYAYDNDLDDDLPSIVLTVNDVDWTRVSDFYDELSILITEDNVYQFVYDRYGRSKIVFNTSRNVPDDDATISIRALTTLADEGDVGANTIITLPDNFLYHVPTGTYFNNSGVTISNVFATLGGAEVESIATIKENAKSGLHAQFRNVTSVDYQANLEQRDDVVVANAWGEQNLTPSGAIAEFNKVYVSVIPDVWGAQTIGTRRDVWTTDWSTSGTYLIPSAYNPDYETNLKTYIEPRKMISAYEIFNLPQLVYFSYEFGVRKKRLFNFDNITTDLKSKLDYYFRSENQNFGDIVNYNDILEYLLDTTEVSDDDIFDNMKGIRNLNIRDFDTSAQIYEPNTDGNYPQYISPSAAQIGNVNQIRKVQLGFNQFPVLLVDTIQVNEET